MFLVVGGVDRDCVTLCGPDKDLKSYLNPDCSVSQPQDIAATVVAAAGSRARRGRGRRIVFGRRLIFFVREGYGELGEAYRSRVATVVVGACRRGGGRCLVSVVVVVMVDDRLRRIGTCVRTLRCMLAITSRRTISQRNITRRRTLGMCRSRDRKRMQ